MNLYKTEPLPIYETVLKRHVQIVPETMCMAVTESRQYYSLLTAADLHKCQQGLFTICEVEFPLYHKRTTCSGALYFGKHNLAHEHCDKAILRKNFKPIWIHYKGTPSFWIHSLPVSTKFTKTCRVNGTMRSTDVTIEGVGIFRIEDNCQVFSENFLLLSTTSGYVKFTLTPGQVIIPELPELLTQEETQVLESHQDQADRTHSALDSLVTRGLPAGQQHDVNLRDLLNDIQHHQHETRNRGWLITAIVLSLIISIIYLTSKCWRPHLLEFASRYARRRTRVPARAPAPLPRVARTCALSMMDEDSVLEMKPIMGNDGENNGSKIVDSATNRATSPNRCRCTPRDA
jgi:hypothetical protein